MNAYFINYKFIFIFILATTFVCGCKPNNNTREKIHVLYVGKEACNLSSEWLMSDSGILVAAGSWQTGQGNSLWLWKDFSQKPQLKVFKRSPPNTPASEKSPNSISQEDILLMGMVTNYGHLGGQYPFNEQNYHPILIRKDAWQALPALSGTVWENYGRDRPLGSILLIDKSFLKEPFYIDNEAYLSLLKKTLVGNFPQAEFGDKEEISWYGHLLFIYKESMQLGLWVEPISKCYTDNDWVGSDLRRRLSPIWFPLSILDSSNGFYEQWRLAQYHRVSVLNSRPFMFRLNAVPESCGFLGLEYHCINPQPKEILEPKDWAQRLSSRGECLALTLTDLDRQYHYVHACDRSNRYTAKSMIDLYQFDWHKYIYQRDSSIAGHRFAFDDVILSTAAYPEPSAAQQLTPDSSIYLIFQDQNQPRQHKLYRLERDSLFLEYAFESEAKSWISSRALVSGRIAFSSPETSECIVWRVKEGPPHYHLRVK